MLAICLGAFLPNTMAATKYNYIANGEKDILGFKISGITQKDECDSIEIILHANKNIVEFSTYQDVVYNGTVYKSGNHTIDKTQNVAFIYTIESGASLSPIIIYLETIENTSCPLEIRYCKEDTVVEKVNMTLVATFYADQASELRENKENSSGSLVQEDVIISRPNVPSKPPVEPTDPVTPPTDPETPPTNPETPSDDPVTPPVEECKHTETKIVGAKEATTEEEGYSGDTVCSKCEKVITKGEKIEKLPPPPSEEVELPIVDDSTLPPKDEDPSIGDDPTIPPNTDPITPPTTDPKPVEKKGFFDFINSIPKTYIYVAIGAVGLLLVIVIVLIIALGSKKKKDQVQVEQVPVNVPPMPPTNNPELLQEQIPEPVPVEPELPVAIPENNDLLIDDDLLLNKVEETKPEPEPIPVLEETVPVTPVIFADPIEEPIEENVEETVVIDEYNEILMATLPEVEIKKIKFDFEDVPDGEENEYENIVL